MPRPPHHLQHFWVEDSAKAAQLDPGLPENTDGEAARPGGPPDSLLPDELDVPLYDRSTDVTLEASTWSALGNASRDEQAPQRCFNCGSYSHKLQTCPRPRDNAAIDAAREQLGESQRRSGIPGLARYHNPLAPDVTPGSLSPALRDALGISALDPPPWLAQMRRLGYPPGYLGEQPPSLTVTQSHADESPQLAFYEDEGGATTILLAVEEEAASLLPSPSPPAAAVDGSEIEEGEMEVSMDLESSEDDGVDGEAVAASTSAPTMAVAYPGINSPIPDGADPRAWGLPSQSIDPGETASRRRMSMGWAAGLSSSLAKHQICTATECLDTLQLGLMPRHLSMCEAAGTSVTHMSAPKLTIFLPSAHVLARFFPGLEAQIALSITVAFLRDSNSSWWNMQEPVDWDGDCAAKGETGQDLQGE
eukprot:SM000082S22805  [mRNA]  locus=s82:122:4834:+ [translate_table: standard]